MISESHGPWVNMPDLPLLQKVFQLQRGRETPPNGAGAFGGKV